MSNATNAITLLTNLKSVITALEAGNIKTGNFEIDQQTRALLATRLDQWLGTVYDNGSRAQQNATQTSRAAANNSVSPAVDASYTQLDLFVRSIDAQVAQLTSPTATPRRAHTTLL
jgi:hypothetical protein